MGEGQLPYGAVVFAMWNEPPWSGGSESEQGAVEDAGAEVQGIDGHTLVHAVEERLVVEALRQLQRREAVAADAQPGELLGVNVAYVRESTGASRGTSP